MTFSVASDKLHYVSSIFPIRLLIPAPPVILLQVGTIQFGVFASFGISPNLCVMLVYVLIVDKGILGCGSTCLDIGHSKTGKRPRNSHMGNYSGMRSLNSVNPFHDPNDAGGHCPASIKLQDVSQAGQSPSHYCEIGDRASILRAG